MSIDLLRHLSNKVQEELRVIEADMAIYRGLLVANNLIAETAQRMEQDDD